MREERRTHASGIAKRGVCAGKQKREPNEGGGRFSAAVLWLLLLALSVSFPGMALAAPPAPLLRPFDIDDPRFCDLAPEPFVCRRCLEQGMQFAQRIEWPGEEHRPLRSYLCLPWSPPYLQSGSADGSINPSSAR